MVPGAVVVRVGPGEEGRDRDALGRVAVMVAARVETVRVRWVVIVVERQRLREPRWCPPIVKVGADAVGADDEHGVHW